MADRKQRLMSVAITFALAGLNLVALNFLVSGWSTARLDLTSENLFSISPATKRIVTSLDEDLTILGYFSKRTHPKLAPLVPEVVDLLDEYRAVSKGRIHVEIVDPGEDEAVEEEAADRFGVRSTPFRLASKYEAAIVNAYFAVVIKYGDQYVRYGFEDLIQVEPAPDGDIDVRLRNLEYDLTRAIKKVVFGFRSTNELFERIESPVRLTAVWTPDTLPELFSGTPDAVRKAIEELEAAGGEKFVAEELDPSQSEDLRQQVFERFGARPMALGLFGDQEFYLYGFLQIGDEMEQLALTGESVNAATVREAVESSLRRHTPGFLKTVGVAAPAPPDLPHELMMQMPQPQPEFEEIKRLLGQDYQVREIRLEETEGVPTDVDILLVLKPTNLGEDALYNLDQYLMRGGRVVLCAGNYNVDFGAGGLQLAPLDTGLDDWLAHHGVTVEPTLVLDDRNQALPVPQVRNTPFGAMRTWTLAPYPYLVQVREDGFLNPEITATLDAVGIYWGSPLSVDPEKTAELEVIPILQSSDVSWTSDDLSQAGFVDYSVPAEGTEPHLLAAALSGRFSTYFAGREDDETASRVPLQQSPETRLVVIGDSQFLSDFVARALAQVDGGFFVENLRFVQNVIDWVGLDNDMLGIRARGLTSRRLERVGRGTEVAVETFNYIAPVVVLTVLGFFLRWRRRQAAELAVGSGGGAAGVPLSREV